MCLFSAMSTSVLIVKTAIRGYHDDHIILEPLFLPIRENVGELSLLGTMSKKKPMSFRRLGNVKKDIREDLHVGQHQRRSYTAFTLASKSGLAWHGMSYHVN